MSDDSFTFLDESVSSGDLSEIGHEDNKRWKILTVDDDENYQSSLTFSLDGLKVSNREVEILTANSATEAAIVLSQHDDISVILLDVVMERDDAGLRLVENIRNVQGNALVRIILLTGQPGFAPRQDVMHQYDINEYWNKSDIDHDILKSVVSANLRSWKSMYDLDQARAGLQMVVDASRKIASKYDTEVFVQVVLKEISELIAREREPCLCVIESREQQGNDEEHIIAVSDSVTLEPHDKKAQEVISRFRVLIDEAHEAKTHVFNKNSSVLYFPIHGENRQYFVLVESYEPLSEYHIRLLQVFSENINSGFMQIALVNQLSKLAYQDSELGINNRNWLLRELEIMTEAEISQLELLVVELTDYDSHAISFKQQSLVDFVSMVFNQLSEVFKFDSTAVITRVGSDRFAVLYNKQFPLSDDVLLDISNRTYDVNGYLVRSTMTFARIELSQLASFPAGQILHIARSLLFSAHENKQQVVTYHPLYREELIRDYQILGDLKAAIDNREFYVALQPKCDLRTGKVVGLESLLRWEKQETLIPPSIFIPLAERTGLISKLDAIAAELTFQAMKEVNQAGFILPISINATVADLTDPDYIHLLIDLIEEKNISPALVEIEITESQAMESYEEVKPILDDLHKAGFNISIDDFGTGYSSLSHISQLAVDVIKIDISFIRHLQDDPASQQVVDLVMRLAELFDFSVVGEGIETKAQRDALLERGCCVGQGYLYAKPMPTNELLVWLRHNRDTVSE